MKNSPLMTVLLVMTTISAVLAPVLSWQVIKNTRKLRNYQTQIAIANNNRNMINVLATAANEYSKKNSAIDPILEWIGAKPSKTPATPGAPSAKPATK